MRARVSTIGLLLTVLVTAAGVQDRDGARPLRWNLREAFPKIKRPDDLHTFQVLPRHWVAERTLAWITRHRRTVRDYERLTAPRDRHLLGHDHHHEPPPGPAKPSMSAIARACTFPAWLG